MQKRRKLKKMTRNYGSDDEGERGYGSDNNNDAGETKVEEAMDEEAHHESEEPEEPREERVSEEGGNDDNEDNDNVKVEHGESKAKANDDDEEHYL